MKFRDSKDFSDRLAPSHRPKWAMSPDALPKLATAVDPAASRATVSIVKLRHVINKISRLNLTKADREIVILKDQFRREDQELLRQGRGAEIAARNRQLMGIKEGEKTRLVGFGGVRFE